MTSIASYPDRCRLWGEHRYRGNCDGRLFKNLVLRYRAWRVADPMMGSGTTRDVAAGLNSFQSEPIEFWGGDRLSGFYLSTTDLPGVFDFVWMHPPYWNIVRCSDHPTDLSNAESYEDSRHRLCRCLLRCSKALNPGGRLAVLVGDVRRRGACIPIVRDVLRMEPLPGQLRSIIIKAQHHCRSDSVGYARMEDVPIQHGHCVVFKRPVP